MNKVEGTKTKIFNAAVTVFANKGFNSATMDEIAKTAKVAKGTLYYHFKSKEEIFKFLSEQGVSKIKEEIYDRTKDISNPMDKLKEVIIVQMDLMYSYGEFFKMVLSQIWKDNDREEYFRGWIYDYIKVIEDYIQEGIDANIIKPDNKRIAATAVFGMISSISIYRLMTEDEYSKEEMAAIITKQLMDGIKNK